jgi:hypothetical protein
MFVCVSPLGCVFPIFLSTRTRSDVHCSNGSARWRCSKCRNSHGSILWMMLWLAFLRQTKVFLEKRAKELGSLVPFFETIP